MNEFDPTAGPRTLSADRAAPAAGATPDVATLVASVNQSISRGDLQNAWRIGSRACRLHPDAASLFHAVGVAEAMLGNTQAAITNEEQALVRDPGLREAEQNLVRLRQRRTTIDAILKGHAFEARERAAMDPADRAALYLAIGRDLMAIEETTNAAAFFHKAVEHGPKKAEALVELGFAYQRCDRLHDAINCFRRAIAVEPRNASAVAGLIRALQDACLWDEYARLRAHQAAVLPALEGKAAVAIDRPFANLIAVEDPAENRRAAERYARLIRARAPLFGPGAAATAPARDARLRIGYLSSDFRYHPVGQLAAAILARHDRTRFAVHAYSVGANDESGERQAVAENCERFRDLARANDQAIAEAIAGDGIDILVDLNGYTRGCRPGVLALRPAPVQVWALGFPGTSGSDFVDYIVADGTVLPPEHLDHFSEQPCWLPHACQPLDDRQPVADRPPSRTAIGLPADGFLFVSWQNAFKIQPRTFDLWMDILRAVPDSWLWLRQMPAYTRRNLGIEARRRKIDPDRLICAPEVARDKPRYLAHLGVADLALDTLGFNGHATTSDLLRAGVPVVTLLGGHFAGRVAASLLQAAGLPELVTYSARAYRDLAVKLALDPARLAALRGRLKALHESAPLFDNDRYVRALERGYETMAARHRAGEKPAPIAVEADA